MHHSVVYIQNVQLMYFFTHIMTLSSFLDCGVSGLLLMGFPGGPGISGGFRGQGYITPVQDDCEKIGREF